MFGENHVTANLWKLSVAVLAASLAYVFYMLSSEGHAAFNTSSDGVNWGSAIATYVFFALTSSGLTFIASLSTVFGFKQFYPVAKRCIWLAIVTLIAGFAVLALELGHPFRMLWAMPLGMQIRSAMFWMGVFYSIDLVLLFIKFYLLWREDWDSSLSRFVGASSFVAVVLASGMLGLVFGSLAMRPMWFGSATSLFFIISGALSGAAAIVVSVYLAYGFDTRNMPAPLRALKLSDQLPKVFATLIGIVLLFLLTRIWVGLWSNQDGMEGFVALLRAPWFHLEVWVCLALPFLMMLSPSMQVKPRWQVLASVLVLLGMFIERLQFIVAGQNVPMFKGTWMNAVTPYTPSLTEWALVAVGISSALALYALGDRLFNLSDAPKEQAGY
ncbi:MAG: polysulfide reductase [Gammaproteobacteria bacterium RIFOXYA12_FULL_61_12]|nr:MAG: polysulfide reductase [Gammaproteobacteria bacterium RIFOXYD12_FULL_61_37]OGT93896.1 MAG: polysulfide reductase [Gammaproteobacteria bacterium RIFOXYA12_FULL_61_12]